MVGLTGLLSNRYKLEDIPDLSGKVAVVSGGSRGIGEALVGALAKKGCEVHILGATPDHLNEAIDIISSQHPPAKSLIHPHTVDLGSISSVTSLIPTLSKLPRIDMLYMIAGIGVAPFGFTKDNLGNHFQVNNLSQMLLVDGLLPKLKETAESKQGGSELERFSTRIVSESSELHRGAPGDVKFDSLEEMNTDIGAARLYNRSKLANILFIKELVKHLPALSSSTPIIAVSTHPGAVATEQQQGATEAYGTILGKALETAAAVGFMSNEQGAESASWAGTSESAAKRREEIQGKYFSEADGKIDTETSQGQDEQLAKNLWDLCVRTLKEKGYEVKM